MNLAGLVAAVALVALAAQGLARDARPAIGGLRPQDHKELDAIRAQPDHPGSGPFAADYEAVPEAGLVLFHPADLEAATLETKLRIYVWGNGACSQDAGLARVHLSEIASHGYVAVVPGRLESGPKGKPPAPGASSGRVRPVDMIAALDWILAENERAASPYYRKLDTRRIAVGGNSCGGLLAMATGLDPRVRALSVQNSGVLPPAYSPVAVFKQSDLDRLHTPILYIVGGPEDMAQPFALSDFKHVRRTPVFVAERHGVGHVGIFMKAGDRGTKIELDWLAWQLDGDLQAARTFTGTDCGLCRDPNWTVYRKDIR